MSPRSRRGGVIYALVDPRTDEIFWVGMTSVNAEKRFAWHLRDCQTRDGRASAEPRRALLRALISSGTLPELRILEIVATAPELAKRERAWIAHGRAEQWPLTNYSPGGVFDRGEWTEEQRAAKSEYEQSAWPAERRQRHTDLLANPAVRQKISAGVRRASPWVGRKHTATSRLRMSETARAMRVKCGECAMVTHPFALSSHQRKTGHQGSQMP